MVPMVGIVAGWRLASSLVLGGLMRVKWSGFLDPGWHLRHHIPALLNAWKKRRFAMLFRPIHNQKDLPKIGEPESEFLDFKKTSMEEMILKESAY